MRVIGLMSGTSMDAIDAAAVEIRQEGAALELRLLGYVEQPFAPELRERLQALLPPAAGSTAEVCELHMLAGEAFAEAALAAAAEAGLPPGAIDLVASHGQTVYHQVAPGRARSTLQIGAPAAIAERTGRTVVADFRPRDIAAGGQGAPLAPYLDALLWRDATRARALQNIGGIANLTYLPPSGALAPAPAAIAFDTGPGNMLIDAAARLLSGGRLAYDEGGAWAAEGAVDEALLAGWLADGYFQQPPPKSTGRERYGRDRTERMLGEARARGLGDADALATLTALTARSIAHACRRFLPAPPDELIVSGGGARNATLMRMLAEALPEAAIRSSDELGLPAEAKEAVLFAVLGYAALHGWPAGMPGCTGARHAAVLGSVTPGDNYLALLRQVAAADLPPPERAALLS